MQPNALKAVTAYWQNPEAFGTCLLILFLDTYGTEGLGWTPETIDMELSTDFGDVPAANFDRLMTACSLLTSNSFFKSPVDFVKICMSLSGIYQPAEHMLLPDSDDIAWGVTEGLLISPPDDNDNNPFDPEIVGLIGQVLDEEGILVAPDVLRIGVRGADLRSQVDYDFSDDPEMFGAIQKTEQERTDRINHTIQRRSLALMTQLRDLPLTNGKTDFVQGLIDKLTEKFRGG